MTKQGYRFSTFQGVFTPSILTILGVIMYMRFGWVLGQVGLVKTLLIVTISTAITFLTALSISELATNMKVGGGGAYYIISRSLGVEAGGAIGIPLFFAQALGISFYVAGFSESLSDLFPQFSAVQIGTVTLLSLAVLAYFSADLALKFQFFIFLLILLSLVSFFMGGKPEESSVLTHSAAVVRQPFWAVFAVFFPAVTGIEAGLSMSGDLKSPEKSLPRGTLAAVIVSFLVYLAIPLFYSKLKMGEEVLIQNPLIMRDVAKWGQVILWALWGATLSSALGALLGAPRTLQALANDGVIPRWIGRGFGKKKDPRIATAFSAAVAFAGIVLGDLNLIAPLLSMFFLTSYGLLNFSAAAEGLLGNPSWRPKFKVSWIFPALGAVGCLLAMLMINVGATLAATLVSGGVYAMMKQRKLYAYWGDARYGILSLLARFAIYRLAKMKPNEKTWRPNIMVLSGSPASRWYLIALADAVSHGKGFLTVASIVPGGVSQSERIEAVREGIRAYLEKRNVPALVKVLTHEDVYEGARSLVRSYGFGPLVPNTVLAGHCKDETKFNDFAHLIEVVFLRRRNLVIVRETDQPVEPIVNKRIDIWWRREGNNGGLMMALGYMLKSSPEWQGSRLVINTIVDNDTQKDEVEKALKEKVRKENLEAEVEVLVESQEKVMQAILAKSQDASLVFMGLRPPGENETSQSYAVYYRELSERLRGLPVTALVLASEQINFDRIFKLRE